MNILTQPTRDPLDLVASTPSTLMAAVNRNGSTLLLSAVIVLIHNAAVHGEKGIGATRLWRNGSPSSDISSGRVQVNDFGIWGNVCSDDFVANSADVVCHQLGYTGAASFSDSSRDNYGTDDSPTLLTEVRCSDPDFLVIFQCDLSYSSVCPSAGDVSVECYSTRIWDNPYDGQVRLTGGDTVNEGLVEIYCNGQWGTVCDDSFGSTEADTVCRQLGYSGEIGYGHLPIERDTSQPIWLNNVSCNSTSVCVANCQSCPQTEVANCRHDEDVTVQCYYLSIKSPALTTTCVDANGTAGLPRGLIVLVSLGGSFAVLVVLVIVAVLIYIGLFKSRQVFKDRIHSRSAFWSIQRRRLSVNVTSPSTPYPAQPVAQEPQKLVASYGSFQASPSSPPSPPPPPSPTFKYSELTDPTLAEAQPTTFGQHVNFATYTGPSGEDKSKQLPPYPNPPP